MTRSVVGRQVVPTPHAHDRTPGVLDMAGNVEEWVADKYMSAWYETCVAECTNPQGPDGPLEPALTEKLSAKRAAEKEKLFSSLAAADGDGLDGLIEVFGKCVGCHGCGHVCPICYCLLCDFESRCFDYDVSYFEKQLSEKGALRLPPDTIFFHLGRMTHMSFSCVGCGQCSDVCPVGIPVAAMFKKVGQQTSSLFDYLAGRDVEEAIPVMVFKEEEFHELG